MKESDCEDIETYCKYVALHAVVYAVVEVRCLALKHGITLPNTPGTIDSDYRGPLGVIVMNAGSEPFTIGHGDRIAQMVVAPVVQAALQVVEELDETLRGVGGFGSTGRR